ncbi:MAG: hypothetical protein ABUR63_08165, partial [Verrucomicrobiota bacterium]
AGPSGSGGTTSNVNGPSGSGGAGGLGGAGGSGGASSSSGGSGSSGASGSFGKGGASGSSGRGGAAGAVETGGGTGAGGAGTAAGDPPGYVPAIIGVGYGGIRIVSRDGGKTWGDRAYATTNGGDDQELLRAIVYGNGLWIATGWKLVTSNDGIHWVDHGLLADRFSGCNIVEGLAYKDGVFFAGCPQWSGPSVVYRSLDGLSWTKGATIGDTGGHLFLTYRGDKFVAYGDTLTSYQSDDALTWTVLAGVQQATYCQGAFASQSACLDSAWFDGVWLRADWQGKISRSTDGKTFSQAYLDDQKNTLYSSRALAAGFVAPL